MTHHPRLEKAKRSLTDLFQEEQHREAFSKFMKYCEIDDQTKHHLFNLISFIHDEVISSSGDGDFLWYSQFYNVRDIFCIVKDFNETLKLKWDVVLKDDKTIIASMSQEGFIITNDEEIYKNAPFWQQGLLKL